jgi:hypothetical protein
MEPLLEFVGRDVAEVLGGDRAGEAVDADRRRLQPGLAVEPHDALAVVKAAETAFHELHGIDASEPNAEAAIVVAHARGPVT